jgi:hypothetical protein
MADTSAMTSSTHRTRAHRERQQRGEILIKMPVSRAITRDLVLFGYLAPEDRDDPKKIEAAVLRAPLVLSGIEDWDTTITNSPPAARRV